MPRRKPPSSTRQKKANTQLKRAIKRGDIKKTATLQSTFVNVSKDFLQQSMHLSSQVPLPRPIQPQSAVFDISLLAGGFDCPRRPKWKYDMLKLEVHRNEESLFKTWLQKADATVAEWQASSPTLRSTTYFERNLEVWRELWRVTEISDILLVLLDSRCPLLHYPPSLAAYLSATKRRHILVLTKVDIAGPARADAWADYFSKHYPGIPVVQVEAYVEKEPSQGKAHYEPHLPVAFRSRLIEALKQVHKQLLEPPEKLKDKPAALARWKPPARRDIDWNALMNAHGGKVGSIVGGSIMPQSEDSEEERQFLSVGLIGQPNMGKSSLISAIFGTRRVRASKSPGMTKHLQTLFWTHDVRLVDCPGLVMPSLVPMELQVLSGILPISRIAAVPACVQFACQYLPLEKIFKLTHPNKKPQEELENKRTWRDGMARQDKQELTWTAMDVLIAYADLKGWQTAKAGRPDIHRAGNAMLRALAEGRVLWAFWPPDVDVNLVAEGMPYEHAGIWISNTDELDNERWEEESPESDEDQQSNEAKESEVDTESEEGEEEGLPSAGFGRFGALSLEDVEEDDSDEDAAAV